MPHASKIILILAHLLVLSWITGVTFKTSEISNPILLINYALIALAALALSKLNNAAYKEN